MQRATDIMKRKSSRAICDSEWLV